MTTVILQFPSSPQVIVVATEITTSTVTTCTSAEITEIQAEVNSLNEAVKEIEEALEAVQEQLEELTGSTASSSELESFTTGASTMANTTMANETTMSNETTMGDALTMANATMVDTTMNMSTKPPGRRDRRLFFQRI